MAKLNSCIRIPRRLRPKDKPIEVGDVVMLKVPKDNSRQSAHENWRPITNPPRNQIFQSLGTNPFYVTAISISGFQKKGQRQFRDLTIEDPLRFYLYNRIVSESFLRKARLEDMEAYARQGLINRLLIHIQEIKGEMYWQREVSVRTVEESKEEKKEGVKN